MNYEYAIGEDTTLGATYMKWSANPNRGAAARRARRLQPARLHGAVPEPEGAVLRAEYAQEDNGDALDSTAWNALAAYQFDMTWKPKVSYRYAFFEGDDPATAENEAFDGLFTGFYDWGTWWQGEIAGEYFVSNSNLISHQLRVHTQADRGDRDRADLLRLRARSAGVARPGRHLRRRGATSSTGTWTGASTTTSSLSFVAAVAEPGEAIEQSSGRTDTFFYGMIFAAYSF